MTSARPNFLIRLAGRLVRPIVREVLEEQAERNKVHSLLKQLRYNQEVMLGLGPRDQFLTKLDVFKHQEDGDMGLNVKNLRSLETYNKNDIRIFNRAMEILPLLEGEDMFDAVRILIVAADLAKLSSVVLADGSVKGSALNEWIKHFSEEQEPENVSNGSQEAHPTDSEPVSDRDDR